MDAERSPLRVGHAERTAALQALDEHLAAGRLDVDEYADRSAAAAAAVVAADLAALFTDLPEPHPPLPGGPKVPPPGEVAAPQPAPVQRWEPPLMGVVLVLAIGLFLLTRQGVLILLIPLVAVLLWTRRRR
ncbi:DUF1707 domain-containing protein [Pseudonocardia sp. MH-G8]|uniref:DUF1707 SHOCT-like domain-containing protein n=1 Tax=Pseudonocardia sp. MH-G8 TaxID=1854588 RepID=UPI000BA0329B|nr:DUF1707 domain-containing protein [Pseudonocardia sp. MH-G8]OZM82029.1 hypothetical protein CFP66_14055 [Pseudonocardia sp. MH-G8]